MNVFTNYLLTKYDGFFNMQHFLRNCGLKIQLTIKNTSQNTEYFYYFSGYSPFDNMGSSPLHSLHSKGSLTASYSEHCPQSLPPFTGRYGHSPHESRSKSREFKFKKDEGSAKRVKN